MSSEPTKKEKSNNKGALPPGWSVRESKTKPGKKVYQYCSCFSQWDRPSSNSETIKFYEGLQRKGTPITPAEPKATRVEPNIVPGGSESISREEVLIAPTPKIEVAKPAAITPPEPKATIVKPNIVPGGSESISREKLLNAPPVRKEIAEPVRVRPQVNKPVMMPGSTCGSLPPQYQEECRKRKASTGGRKKSKGRSRKNKKRKGGKTRRR
jgi:hypothetical protein